MYYKNTLSEITAELEYRRDYAEKAMQALKAVTINKTKSGKEFDNLSRALTGAKKIQEYGFDRIAVYFSTSRKMYEYYTIDIYGYLDELPESDPRHAEYIPQVIRQKYIFTANEIRTRIEKEIDILSARVADYERQIEKATAAAKKYRDTIEKAEKELSATLDNPGQIGHTSAYYLITETR